jgi:superfamily II DNA or RNA helicase
VKQTYNKFSAVTDSLSVVKSGMDDMFNADARVQIIGLQTYHARKPSLDADVLLIDEIHDGYGSKMQAELIKTFSDAKLIGLSASPIDSKGYLLQGFDAYINEVQTADLIKLGYLAKPITYSPVEFDLSSVSMVGDDYNNKEVDDIVIDLNKVKNIVDNWVKLARNKKTLVFANSIKHAEMLYSEFKRQGFNDIDIIHSQIDDLKERRKSIKDKQIIINCGILTTGYDDDTIECVLLARPTAVLKLYLQIVGRGLRVNPNKKECLILDCANCVSKHGLVEDVRYYVPRKPKNDEPLFQQCPECGNIEPIHVKQCSICGYDLTIAIEQSKGTSKQTKKQLEQLIRTYSLQDEVYNKIRELVKAKGYKPAYSWFLFKEMLQKRQTNISMLQFYKTKLTKIQKIIKNNYNIKSIIYK